MSSSPCRPPALPAGRRSRFGRLAHPGAQQVRRSPWATLPRLGLGLLMLLTPLLAATRLAAADAGGNAGNEIVLCVDRYTFTQADIDTTEKIYLRNEWIDLMQARQKLAANYTDAGDAQVADMADKLERHAISILITSVETSEQIPPEMFSEELKSIGEDYDRNILATFPTLEQFMDYMQWTPKELEEARRRYVANQVRRWVIGRILQNEPAPTDKERRDYYDKHKDQFTVEKGYKIRVLVLNPDKHPNANLYALADGIRKQYLDGKATFIDLVRKYSDNPQTREIDGLWKCKAPEVATLGLNQPGEEDWVTLRTGRELNPTWIDAAMQLDPTQHDRRISPVLQTSTGYSLVYLESTRPARLVAYKDVPTSRLLDLTEQHKSEIEINRWTRDRLSDSRIVYRGKVVSYSEFWNEDLND
ncbi:MAG: peptidylprolyl isomerase [Planctomycetota bacterium]